MWEHFYRKWSENSSCRQRLECLVIHKWFSVWFPYSWDICSVLPVFSSHCVRNSLSHVPSVRWMWVRACVCACLHVNARIHLGAERDCQYHTTRNWFYNEPINDWTDLPQNNILSNLPLKALAMWRCVNYHLVRTSSQQQMQGGRDFIIILDHREACLVLLQFFKKCPFLLTPQMRENSPAISPTNASTALFGLKPRSGKLKP